MNILKRSLILLFILNSVLFAGKLSKKSILKQKEIRKDFSNLIQSKMQFYTNKTNEELKKTFLKQMEYYKRKENIESYTFTTNYNIHAETGAIIRQLLNPLLMKSLLFLENNRKVIDNYLKNRKRRYDGATKAINIYDVVGHAMLAVIYSSEYILLIKQLDYNEKNEIYSEKFLKKSTFLIVFYHNISNGFIFDNVSSWGKLQKKWLDHKTKAKKAGWPAVDGAKY